MQLVKLMSEQLCQTVSAILITAIDVI